MTITQTQLHGTCAPGFEPVRAAFAENLARRGELGAAVAVVAQGRPVVDLWAGWADPARTRPWQAGTLTNVWSVTKAMTAVCVHILMDRAGLDPDQPVARYWPEFAAGGKSGVTVRWLMSHRAGLAGFAEPVSVAGLADWEKMTSLLAAQEPLWQPGTAAGYHAVTFGYLAGELVRRITGQSPGRFFATEVAGPLGADACIGVPAADLARCSELQAARLPPDDRDVRQRAFAAAHPAAAAAIGNPVIQAGDTASPAWRQAEIPAANGHATALGLATIFGSLVDGSQALVSAATVRAAATGQGRSTDLVLRLPLDYGLGFMLSGPEGHFGPSRAAFGHDGSGGCSVWADPERGVALAYVMNRMGRSLMDDPRKMALTAALAECLGQGAAPAFTF
ncbi:MAG: serine hydrolase domain-containing protein [Gemmatimonadota bacterium]